MALVTVVLLMTAMFVASAGIAQALTLSSGTVIVVRTPSGVAVDPAVCEVLAEVSAMFEWRADGEVCWVNSPVSANNFRL